MIKIKIFKKTTKLTAILKSSTFLQTKYAQSLSEINHSSQNFNSNHIWLQIENNEVINSYKMLPPLYENWNDEELAENISEPDTLAMVMVYEHLKEICEK